MSKDSTAFVGLDVHKDSITVACIGAATTDPVIAVGTIGTQQYAIDHCSLSTTVVVTAIARELGAFIWAAARLVQHTTA